jgi:hypothetical protein
MSARRIDAAPAEVLRTAALVLRQLAAEVTPGPWEIEYTYDGQQPQAVFRMHPDHPDDPDLSESLGTMDQNPADNAWVAMLGPQIAEPLAAWLEEFADRAAFYVPIWERGAPAVEDHPPIRHDVPALVEHHYGRALNVARVLLGGEPR